MKKILQKILRFMAIKALKKYSPKVIGITGSMGKSSAKEAVFAVLSKNFNVRKSEKSFNNEIGVPLTILGLESGEKNIFKWIKVLFSGFLLLIKKSPTYPEILILEMGAEYVGDMKYLTDFVKCNVGVVTSIAPVHIEFFKSLEGIAKEKKYLVSTLDKSGTAILNADDPLVLNMKKDTKAKVLTFGFSDNADVQAFELVEPNFGIVFDGIKFKIKFKGAVVPVLLPAVLGRHQIYAALAAAAVGLDFGLNLIDISENLKAYRSPAGRMNLIPGIKNTLLVDDTYNSSPKACLAALETVGKIELEYNKNKYAVLGDMLQLGDYSKVGHQEVGEKVAALKYNFLVTVGKESLQIAKSAIEKGFYKENIFSFDNSPEAGRFLQDKIKQGDLLLIKGSQGMRMEKIVKELMANPELAGAMLVRQTEGWLAE